MICLQNGLCEERIARIAGPERTFGGIVAWGASMVEPGTRTARAYYNSRGWIAHVVTNPWGFTSPGEAADWGSSVSGSAWLCHHLWEHYEFTQDRKFLREYYQVLRGCCLFYLDNLFEEPTRQWLVTGPSSSPENRFRLPDGKIAHICMAPAIDMQLLRELFGNTAEAARILGVDPELRKELLEKRIRLVPNRIGPDDRIMEWLEPYAEPDPRHNHSSPLYGLFPYNEITPRGTPDLAAAAAKLLIARGENNACWPYAWRSNLWARLGDGERAMTSLKHVLRPFRGPSGVSANLFSYGPFQIDANMGACAAIPEMIVQSHTGEIELLPALPKAWPDGSLQGIKARGGHRVNLAWSGGVLREASLESPATAEVNVRYRDKVVTVKLKPGVVTKVPLGG
jgi:alpha-L-fucosidase 2